jgi:hypothetical protein
MGRRVTYANRGLLYACRGRHLAQYGNRKEQVRMQEDLQKIQRWAMHGTVRQAYADMAARLTTEKEYTAELADETMVFYRQSKGGGLFGLFGKGTKTPVLKIIRKGEEIEIPEEPRDEEFINVLSRLLEAH